MISEEQQRNLFLAYYGHIFKDPEITRLVSDSTCKQIQNGSLTLSEWIISALKKPNLDKSIMDRLKNALLLSMGRQV